MWADLGLQISPQDRGKRQGPISRESGAPLRSVTKDVGSQWQPRPLARTALQTINLRILISPVTLSPDSY